MSVTREINSDTSGILNYVFNMMYCKLGLLAGVIDREDDTTKCCFKIQMVISESLFNY